MNTSSSKKDAMETDGGSRFKQIRQVFVRNKITRGITPEKLRIILEELGPTYIKLGQIMSLHSDILPKSYCDELLKLNSDVKPMPFSEVEQVLLNSYQTPWSTYFKSIDHEPIGSASIAQVHRAVTKDNEQVIIKVQREGIYETMSSDIAFLHKLVKLMPPVLDFKNLVDLDMVVDEMWQTAKQEMNFLTEADHIEEFSHLNKDIVYVTCPVLYRQYSTDKVLVMEYIDGYAINDVKSLRENEYDLNEIGTKFINNFLKQVMDDGFFHADPHPGNVKIRDGKIVWIDMGMMGRLSEHDRKIMIQGVKGIALHDVSVVEDAVLQLGEFTAKPDRAKLYSDLKEFLNNYANTSMGNIDIAETVSSLMEIMKQNHIQMPHGMTMLCRGLSHMQGVLREIAPDIDMYEIASTRMKEKTFQELNLKDEITKNVELGYRNLQKGAQIPSLLTDIMKEYLEGQSNVHITLHSSETFTELVRAAVRNAVIGICVAALFISSSIICLTDMTPKVFGIPLLGFTGYFFAIIVSCFFLLRYFYRKHKSKNS